MKLTIRNYQPIEIADADLVPLAGEFKGDTPYVAKLAQRLKLDSYRENKLPAKLMCLETLAKRAENLGGWSSFAEPMAGAGLTARIFGGPNRELILGDLDESCRRTLAANFNVTPIECNILSTSLPGADMIFMDFNDFTYKRGQGIYNPVLKNTFSAANKFVIINDCTVFYFRYGKNSYDTYSKKLGVKIRNFNDYFQAVRKDYSIRFGWYLVHVAYFRDSSFQLFAKEDNLFVTEEITPEPIVEVI